MEDKRKFPRREIDYMTFFKGGAYPLENARARNISRCGLFLETFNPPEEQEFIKVNLEISEYDKELGLFCKVVRKIPFEGMGLEIISSTNDELLAAMADGIC